MGTFRSIGSNTGKGEKVPLANLKFPNEVSWNIGYRLRVHFLKPSTRNFRNVNIVSPQTVSSWIRPARHAGLFADINNTFILNLTLNNHRRPRSRRGASQDFP